MNCFLCNAVCDTRNENSNKKLHLELITDIVKKYLLLEIKEKDLIICKPCLILLEELNIYRCKAKLLEELLTRQTLRNHNVLKQFDPLFSYKLSIDAEAKKYFKHKKKLYTCQICMEFRTYHVDSIAPHYKYHQVNGDNLDATLDASLVKIEPDFENMYEEDPLQVTDDEPLVDKDDVDDILNETISVYIKKKENHGRPALKSRGATADRPLKHNTILKCYICQFEAYSKDDIIVHMTDCHPEKSQIVFIFRKRRLRKPYCDKCGMAYRTRNKCDHMIATIKNCKELSCNFCNLLFYGQEMLDDHLNKIHFQCRLCDITFPHKQKLYMHNYKLHMGKEYVCHLCGRQFQTKGGLKCHIAVHTGNYKFNCEYCGKGLHTSLALKDHLSNHTKEEPYSCDLCGQTFKLFGSYRLHRRWHENPFPYPCTHCPRKFSTASFRVVHMRRVHTKNPMRHYCNYCNKSYFLKSSLNMHMQNHTGRYSYNCTKCSAGFCRKSTYAEHMIKIHNDYSITKRITQYKIALRPEARKNITSS